MKINDQSVYVINRNLSRNLFRFSFILTLLLASTSFLSATKNVASNAVLLTHEGAKMTVVPTEKNQAIVELYSSSSEATIVVFNSSGELVFEEIFYVETNQTSTIKLDLSTFRAGIYFVVHDENKDSATISVQ